MDLTLRLAAGSLQFKMERPAIWDRVMVRYPKIRVSLRTANPLALVSAVRSEMRRAGLERHQIDEFSTEALTSQPSEIPRVCSSWVALQSVGAESGDD